VGSRTRRQPGGRALPTSPRGGTHASSASDTVAETVTGLESSHIGYRTDRHPFDNELVRKAFSHALERDRLFGDKDSAERPAGRGGLLPPAMPGHSHRISPPFDLELAKRLLAEAGYPDAKGLPEIKIAIPEHWELRESNLAAQWGRLGVRIKVLSAPLESFFTGPLEAAHAWCGGWSADFPDPEGFIPPLLANYPIFRNEEITALVGKARTCRDQEQRIQLFRDIDRLLVADRCALVPIGYGAAVLLRRPWVHGLHAMPLLGPSTPLDQVIVRH